MACCSGVTVMSSCVCVSASARVIRPRSRPIEPTSSLQADGVPACAGANVHVARPSLSRCRSTVGCTSCTDGTLMRWASNGSGDRSKPQRRQSGELRLLRPSGLAMLMSRAVNCGHGTSACSHPARAVAVPVDGQFAVDGERPTDGLAHAVAQPGLGMVPVERGDDEKHHHQQDTSTPANQLAILALRFIHPCLARRQAVSGLLIAQRMARLRGCGERRQWRFTPGRVVERPAGVAAMRARASGGDVLAPTYAVYQRRRQVEPRDPDAHRFQVQLLQDATRHRAARGVSELIERAIRAQLALERAAQDGGDLRAGIESSGRPLTMALASSSPNSGGVLPSCAASMCSTCRCG